MVNWGTAEPWPLGDLKLLGTLCQHVRSKNQKHTHSTHLVFYHLHADLQAFPTDVADDLVLVPQLGQLGHDVGAHVEADPLRAVVLNCLSTRTILKPSGKAIKSHGTKGQGKSALTSSTDEAMAQATGFPPKVLK